MLRIRCAMKKHPFNKRRFFGCKVTILKDGGRRVRHCREGLTPALSCGSEARSAAGTAVWSALLCV